MAVRDAARWLTAPPAAGELVEARPLTARNYFMLWAALSASFLAFVPGAYLVPALTLRDAIIVALLGSVVGAAVVGGVAAVAAQRRFNTVGLLSNTLGIPASGVIAAFLLLRHIVWATFMLAFAANVAAHVPGLAGSSAVWGIVLGAFALVLALMPVQMFVRRWIGWFTFWVGLLIIAAVTVTGVTTYGIPVLHDADGLGGWPTQAQGFDLIAALPLLWLPVVADYAREASSERDAGYGSFAGAALLTAWYAIVGVLWVFTVNARDVAGFMSALPLGAAGIAVVVALQVNPIAANVYAGSMTGGRFGYRWFRPALIATGVLAAVLVVATDALNVEDFALLLAAIFLPLFAVVLARQVTRAPRPAAWAAWVLGVLAYGWINPGLVGPWHEMMRLLFSSLLHLPFPLGGDLTQVPATVVSFAVAGGAYLAAGQIAARRRR